MISSMGFDEAEVSQPLQEVVEWVSIDYFTDKVEPIIHMLARYLSISLGLASSIYTFLYAESLGERVGLGLGGGIVLGYSATLPIAALGWVNCDYVGGKLVETRSLALRKVSASCTGPVIVEKGIRFPILIVFGILGATPLVYACHTGFAKYSLVAAVIFDVPTAIAKSVLYGWATNNLYQTVKQSIQELILGVMAKCGNRSLPVKRYLIKMHLQKAIEAIKRLSASEVELLSDSLFASSDDIEANITAYHKLMRLFELGVGGEQNEEVGVCRSVMGYVNSVGRVLVGFFGGVVGYLGSYVIVPLGKEAVKNLLASWGVDDKASEEIATVFGWLSAFCIGSLLAYATKDSLQKFYDTCVQLPGACASLPNLCKRLIARRACEGGVDWRVIIRKSLMALSVVLAVTSALPRVELTLENVVVDPVFDKLILAAVSLGAVSKDFWSLESFLDLIIMKGSKRSALIARINKIIEKL